MIAGHNLLITGFPGVGQMECFSARFQETAQPLLGGDRRVAATVAMRGSGFIADVKARRNVDLGRLSWENRDHLPADMTGQLI